MLQRRSIPRDSSKLIRIDPENKHTKQNYYINDSEFLKVVSFSPLKNGFFFLTALTLEISAMFLFFDGGWMKIVIGAAFMVASGYFLISRRELYITKEFVRRTYSLSCFGYRSRVWQYKVKFADFSRLDINWPETKHTGSLQQKVQLSIHNYKLGKPLNIMDLYFTSADRELLTDIKQRIEQALGLPKD